MARGTVKDPTGHQSQPHDFGFIQRSKNENNPNLVWPIPDDPENENYKAIPWLKTLKPDGTEYQAGDPIDFHTRTVGVFEFKKFGSQIFVGPFLGTIGIAEAD